MKIVMAHNPEESWINGQIIFFYLQKNLQISYLKKYAMSAELTLVERPRSRSMCCTPASTPPVSCWSTGVYLCGLVLWTQGSNGMFRKSPVRTQH